MDMSKLPFNKFVITLLLLNQDIATIIEKLKEFGYCASEEEISEVFKELRNILPPALKQEVEARTKFQFTKQEDAQWLEHFGIAEFYDFLVRKDKDGVEPPPYFKWFRDVIWLHKYKDIMCLVNILIFNQEEFDSISDIIQFKYKKKIAVEALKFHMNIFWDCRLISAKEALYHCIPFRRNGLILRKMRSGTEVRSLNYDEDDGSDVSFVFHDSNYIKWKIGYKEIHVPTVKDFLEKVKSDSYFKYYEAMNMTQSIEVEEESGMNDKIGAFESTKTKRRNVEEQRARAAKHWLDLFVKADKSIPIEGHKETDFFDKMNKLDLGFDEEKIIDIQESPDILNDIHGDM